MEKVDFGNKDIIYKAMLEGGREGETKREREQESTLTAV